ncbi:MAG TPA: hypothetical protein VKP69_12010 [Isosphaeraceae bacterium]|nr:hypothetical protein [Isosphaeraceae bacterium]
MPRELGFFADEAQEDLCFFTVPQLLMAWTAYREGQITLKDFRVYFALAETLAQSRPRGVARGKAIPKFSAQELRELIGGEDGELSAVRKLLAVGLLRDASKSTMEFATVASELRFVPETLDATLARISNYRQKLVVPVPRRILRLMASSGARRTLIATILGHLLRCFKRGESQPKGCVKASWIAQVFGVSARGVKGQRHRLVALGWLIPQGTCQQILNLYGRSLAINLAWDGPITASTKETFDHPMVS